MGALGFPVVEFAPHEISPGETIRPPPTSLGKGVVLSVGFALPRRALRRMYWLGTAKGCNGPRAISKAVKWVPIVLCS